MQYLLVEDDSEMSALLKSGLENLDTKVTVENDGASALSRLLRENFDLIILDVNLPQLNGLEIARRVRVAGVVTPILFLTAKDSLSDRVTGLDVGGDDYVVKPFEFIELNARIRALTRRAGALQRQILTYGELIMDVSTQRVTLANEMISLSPREFLLLAHMLRNVDVVLTRKQLMDEIWDGDQYIDPNIVDQYVSYIRKKIDRNGNGPIIETIRGLGYRVPRLQS